MVGWHLNFLWDFIVSVEEKGLSLLLFIYWALQDGRFSKTLRSIDLVG